MRIIYVPIPDLFFHFRKAIFLRNEMKIKLKTGKFLQHPNLKKMIIWIEDGGCFFTGYRNITCKKYLIDRKEYTLINRLFLIGLKIDKVRY